jgi:hypothetical protein
MQALQRIMGAINLLRNERLRGFRVDIDVDSTLFGDSQSEKDDRIEFIRVVTQYLQTAGAMATQAPDVVPLLGKLLQFGVRGFRVGRDLEVAISEFVDSAPEMIANLKAQQAQQQQNPAEAAQAMATIESAKLKIQDTQVKGQIDMQAHEAEVKRQHLESQSEAFNAMLEGQRKQMDQMLMQQESQMKQMEQKFDMIRLLFEQRQAAQHMAQPVPQMPHTPSGERANTPNKAAGVQNASLGLQAKPPQV